MLYGMDLYLLPAAVVTMVMDQFIELLEHQLTESIGPTDTTVI
jgi:hypothetical protein